MSFRRERSWILVLPALVLTGLLIGCEGNNPYPMSSIYPESSFAHSIQRLYQLLFFLSIPVFLLVCGLLVVILLRFRERPGQGLPRQIHGNTRLEVAWTLIPAIILAIMAVPSVQTLFADYEQRTGKVGGAPYPIEVIGHQFWWEVRYPEAGVVTANEIHMPVGRPVLLNLTSFDVLHSFWVPRLGGKQTLQPLHSNQIALTAERADYYYGQCGEYCGLSHANMRVRVITQPQAEFDAWIRSQQQDQAATAADRGAVLFQQKACYTCHVIQGLNIAQNNVGPNLTHVGSRTTIAAGVLENNAENMTAWIRNPQEIKPGVLMPALAMTDQERAELVAYLQSLK